MTDYDYDVFISYRRRGNIPTWVENVLKPELANQLDTLLDNQVRIAVDVDILETGADWPNELSDAHLKSKIFLVVLSANYFRSGWCASEWKNALARESTTEQSLVYPIRYNDLHDDTLDKLPESLRDEIKRKLRDDFGQYTTLVNPQSDTNRALEFRDKVLQLCENVLTPAIENSPAFDNSWPTLPEVPWDGEDPRWRSRL